MSEQETYVYVAIQEDRHTDVEVRVFADGDVAIAWAKQNVSEYGHPGDEQFGLPDEELTDLMRLAGWLYYGRYSLEGDCVRVEKHLVYR